MRKQGTISHWNHRGFGFIRPDDGRSNIFFHAHFARAIVNNQTRSPIRGDRVSYIPRVGRNGELEATEVLGA